MYTLRNGQDLSEKSLKLYWFQRHKQKEYMVLVDWDTLCVKHIISPQLVYIVHVSQIKLNIIWGSIWKLGSHGDIWVGKALVL